MSAISKDLFFKNKIAAITGAGSGMGQQLALQLASYNCGLSLSDVNVAGLEKTAEDIRLLYPDLKVITTVLDVSSEEAVNQWAQKTFDAFGKINFIFNNAGVALYGTVEEMATKDIAWIMNINFWGVVYGTRAFLPLLKKSGEGHIINTSSLFGLISEPTQSGYNASKFAVRGFTDSLIEELKADSANVKGYCVMPGGIKTAIANSARLSVSKDKEQSAQKTVNSFNALLRMTAEDAANVILTSVAKGQARILVGTDAKVLDVLNRISPTLMVDAMAYFPKLQALMAKFGKKK